VLLSYDAGRQTRDAAQEAGLSRSQARHWKHQFQVRGMAIFNGLGPFAVGFQEKVESAEDQAIEIDSSVEESKELPFPKRTKRAGVGTEDTLAEAGRKIWLFLLAEMLSHEEGTRLGEVAEELHDMRVATRRMRSAFDVFGGAFKPKVLKPHLKGLRVTGRALGRVRDLDVLLEKALHYVESLTPELQPGMEPLLATWREDSEAARVHLLTHLDSQDYDDFKHSFNVFLQTPGAGVIRYAQDTPVPLRVCELVPILVYTRLAAVRAYDGILSNASLAQLHALRIEFKKLRYTLEYFREVLGESAGQVISDIKSLQDHLGDLHDAEVACQLVNTFLRSWETNQLGIPLIQRQNTEPIVAYLAYLHAERHRLLTTFPERWAYFNRSELHQNLAQAISVL
jgi:CHAD domain-containing protein/transposase-like protein